MIEDFCLWIRRNTTYFDINHVGVLLKLQILFPNDYIAELKPFVFWVPLFFF